MKQWSSRQLIEKPIVLIARVEMIAHNIELGERVTLNGEEYVGCEKVP